MLRLVLSALRARRAQATTLFLLTVLAAGAAASGPPYLRAAADSVAETDVRSARAVERVVQVNRDLVLEGDRAAAVQEFLAAVDAALDLPGFDRVFGLYVNGTAAETVPVPLAYHDGVCQHLVIDGACPSAAGEVLVSGRTAQRLALTLGSGLSYRSDSVPAPVALRVVGIYRPRDASEPYWVDGRLVAARPGDAAQSAHEDALFLARAGFDALHPKAASATLDRLARPDAFAGVDPDAVLARAVQAEYTLKGKGYGLSSDLGALVARINRDRWLVYLGVPVAQAQLLLLCWFALFLAVRYSGEERRPDAGLLKLRGATGRRVFTLVTGQSAAPMLAGGVVGLAAGYLLAGVAATRPLSPRTGLPLAAAGAGVAVLGALLVAGVAELRTLRAPVIDLMRQVPARRRGWRADVLDLLVVALALVGVYEVHSQGGSATGLALLTPGLVALAVGLVAARGVTFAAGDIAHRALREGRLPTALTALYLARRPGVARVVAVLTVAVALLGSAVLAWDVSVRAGTERAALELGADRVLTVQARSRLDLLRAVRAADPGGRYAMAVVEMAGQSGDPALIVDATRLPYVPLWRPEYGVAGPARAERLLRPSAPGPVLVSGGELTLEATRAAPPARAAPPPPTRPAPSPSAASGPPPAPGAEPADRVYVVASLAGPRGERVSAAFGPLLYGRRSYPASAPACAAPGGCRLVSFALLSPAGRAAPGAGTPSGAAGAQPSVPPPLGTTVALHRLDQGAATVVSAQLFGDRARWRPSSADDGAGLDIGAGPGGLELAVAQRPLPTVVRLDPTVYVVDTPVAVPVLVAGSRHAPTLVGDQRISPFGGTGVPMRQVGRAALLPRLGTNGVLMDLEYTDRVSADFGSGDTLQVWLARGTPAGVVARLREQGLQVVADESVAGLAGRYQRQGPGTALRFQLLAGAVGLLLAAGAIALIAAVERSPRAAELAALRAQGARRNLVRAVSLGGYAVVAAVSTVVGVATAVLLRLVAGQDLPLFADGWQLLSPSTAPRPAVAGLALLVVLVVLGAVAAGSGAQLSRRVGR